MASLTSDGISSGHGHTLAALDRFAGLKLQAAQWHRGRRACLIGQMMSATSDQSDAVRRTVQSSSRTTRVRCLALPFLRRAAGLKIERTIACSGRSSQADDVLEPCVEAKSRRPDGGVLP
jgi:hypothetical protein